MIKHFWIVQKTFCFPLPYRSGLDERKTRQDPVATNLKQNILESSMLLNHSPFLPSGSEGTTEKTKTVPW